MLQLKKLVLNNVGAYKGNREIVFEEGLNIIQAQNGCLSGDTLVHFNRATLGRPKKLSDAYKSLNHIVYHGSKGWDTSIQTFVRTYFEDKGTIQLNKALDILYSGIKETYTLLLDNGKSIRATGDHKVLTKRGFVPLLDLVIGQDEVMCDKINPKKSKEERCTPVHIRDSEIYQLRYHKYAKKSCNSKTGYFEYYRLPIHRIIYEAHVNNLSYEEYLYILRNDEEKAKTLIMYSPKEYAIHHKDQNHYNNAIENLELISPTEHAKKHNSIPTRFTNFLPQYSIVKSIDFYGEEDTYDIQCESPNNNFSANGIIVHNSGKSTAIQMVELLIANQYEGSFADYINDDSNTMFSSLDFEYNTVPYTISISCKRGKTSSTTERILLDGNGNQIAKGDEAVEKMAEMFDPALTQYSLVAKQKPIDNIVTCKDAERRELFKKIKEINLEKYVKQKIEPAIEELKTQITNIEKEIYRLENTTYDYKAEAQLTFTEAEIVKKRKELKSLQDKQALIESKKAEYESKKKELEDALKVLDNNEVMLAKKNTLLQASKTSIDNLQSEQYVQEKQKSLTESYNKEVEALQKNIADLKKKIEETEANFPSNLKELQDSIDDADTQLNSIKITKIKYDEEPLKKIERDVATTTQDIKYCENNISSLEKGICPTCGEKCDHKLQEYIDLKIKHEATLTTLLESLEVEKTKKKEYDDTVKENEDNKVKRQNLLSKKELTESKIEALKDKYKTTLLTHKTSITDKEEQIAKAKTKYDKALADIDTSIKELLTKEEATHKQYKEDVAEAIKAIDNQKTIVASLQTVVDSYSISEEDYSALIAPMEKDVKDYEAIIISNDLIKTENERLTLKEKEDKKSLVGEKKKLEETKLSLFNHEQARTILLKDFPNYVVDSSIEDVEIAMNNFIETVYYKSLNIELRSTRTSIKMEYGTGDQKLPAHRLSGAESKIVSLAFINHFNKLVNLNLLILDEPDASLSLSTAESLYESLLSMTSIYKQMVIVTHNERMLNYMTANIETNIIKL